MRFLLALLAIASQERPEKKDDKKPIEWKNLQAGPLEGGKPGTRIKVTLRNGNTLRGTVTHPDFLKASDPKAWRAKPHDFSKSQFVLLDIRLELPDLGGYVAVKQGDIRPPILELNPIDPATLERLLKERETVLNAQRAALDEYGRRQKERDAEDEETRRRAEKEAREKSEVEAIEAKKKQLEKLQEALKVYDRFPEGTAEEQQAGKAWGADRMKLIQVKTKSLTPLTADEQDFMTNFESWVVGKKYREEEKKSKEEKP